MNTTLNILRSPTTTLETKRSIFNQLTRQYYNDDITYEQLIAYIELLYGTKHREFGDRPTIQPIKVPSLLEDQDIPDIADAADLYILASDLRKHGIIGYQEWQNLFPIRHDTAARIRAYKPTLAAFISSQAVEAA
jgi:hypothetical protein